MLIYAFVSTPSPSTEYTDFLAALGSASATIYCLRAADVSFTVAGAVNDVIDQGYGCQLTDTTGQRNGSRLLDALDSGSWQGPGGPITFSDGTENGSPR